MVGLVLCDGKVLGRGVNAEELFRLMVVAYMQCEGKVEVEIKDDPQLFVDFVEYVKKHLQSGD